MDCGPFLFRGRGGRLSVCDVAVRVLGDGRTAVVCTERPDNPGTCVTHSAATLAWSVCRHWGLDPSQLVWIEHNPARGEGDSHLPATWELVTFKWEGHSADASQACRLSWRPVGEADWHELGLSPPARSATRGP